MPLPLIRNRIVELGINLHAIKDKTMGVFTILISALPGMGGGGITADASVVEDADLIGPLVFCLMLGGGLLLVICHPPFIS